MLTERQLDAALAPALAAREKVRAVYSTQRIVAALAAAARPWNGIESPLRRSTAGRLGPLLNCHRDMIDTGLRQVFAALAEPALADWAAREMPQASRNDPAHQRRFGPDVVLHALAGNVPGLAIPPIAACLLARSVCLLRESRRQPIVTQAFLETLSDNDQLLATMVVPLTWPAASPAIEHLAVRRAARVELYGSDRTLAEIAARHPERDLRLHGSRMSIGVLPASVELSGEHFAGFAKDAVLYEGRGCLSLRLLIVEGKRERAAAAAALLARALDQLQACWPRMRQDLESEAERRAFIDRAELDHAAGRGDVWRGTDDSWCVRLLARPPSLGDCPGQRCLGVVAAGGADETAALLQRLPQPLAGAAVAGEGPGTATADLLVTRAALEDAGASWICPPGLLQAPPIDWPIDGVPRLRALLESN